MTQRHSVLVTGANGLLGRSVIESLKSSHDVHAIVHKIPNDKVDNVTYHVVDFSAEWNTEFLPKNVETIFHFAQSSKFRDFPAQAPDVFRVNVDSTARLLHYAQETGVKRFVYASSGGVYGSGTQAFHENSPIVPHGQLGYYLASKLCSEVLVENYAQLMTVAVLRFFFIYGPIQKRSMLIPRLVDSVKNGTPITLQGKDGLSVNPVHVHDATRAIVKALDIKDSITLNIAGPDVFSLRQIAEMAGQYLGKTPVFEFQDTEPKNLIANIDGMKTILAAPTISLREGIKELIS